MLSPRTTRGVPSSEKVENNTSNSRAASVVVFSGLIQVSVRAIRLKPEWLVIDEVYFGNFVIIYLRNSVT